MQPILPKKNAPNFSDPTVQQAFVQETQGMKELLQKELDVNRQEQNLLHQRLELMKSFINDIPSSDPQYSMLVTQVGMDQIELDELKIKEMHLIEQLEKN